MREVSHDGHLPPTLDHPLEQAERLVGVGVRDEAVRPVRHRLGAEPDSGDMIQSMVLENRVHVGRQLVGVHHHRVAAGEENIAHAPGESQAAREYGHHLCLLFYL